LTIEFNCHVCGKLLRTADEKAGRTASCPGCGESVTIPAPEQESDDEYGADEYAQEDDSADDEFEDYESADESASPAVGRPARSRAMKSCPMCGEQISRSASRCPYCGESLRTRRRKRGRGSSDSSLATISLVSGIAGLVFMLCCGCISLPASATAIIVGIVALSRINAGRADGKGLAIAGIACGAAGLLLFSALFFLGFAMQMQNLDQLNL
jgi:DNA-directed RNA polymerase subunit M/transcription elongation factor TFIIS